MTVARSKRKRVTMIAMGIAAVSLTAAACAGGGSGNSPYYGANDSRQPAATASSGLPAAPAPR